MGLPIVRSTAVKGQHRVTPAVYRDFQLTVPTGPGFGVTVDEDKLAFHRRDVRHRERAA